VSKLWVISLMLVLVALGGCGSGSQSASASRALREATATRDINQLEVNFHRATTTKDLDLLMSLFADNATFSVPQQTVSGKDQIRDVFATTAPFKPENHWISETPAYKIRITVAGDRGTLYFECHYVDVATRQLVSAVTADTKVARINGRWLITSFGGAPVILG
jgi:ketosteroid isomerase-like protein